MAAFVAALILASPAPAAVVTAPVGPTAVASVAKTATAVPLSEVATWAYQIQGLERAGAVDALRHAGYDMLVLEPTRTQRGSQGFDTAAMVAALKAGTTPSGRRPLVLAYISVGEAENWRWYWTWPREWRSGEPRPAGWPAFIAARDPDGWDGCYPVAVWRKRWRDIAIYGRHTGGSAARGYRSILDETIRDGFDGVYLDWVAAFEEPAVRRLARRDGVDPRAETVRFLRDLRAAALARAPGFVVVQQNAAGLRRGHPELFGIVDGIAQEGVWYFGEATDSWRDPRGHDVPTPASWRRDYLEDLAAFRLAGLPTFCCEYTVARASRTYARAARAGLTCYCTRASLGRLSTTPPPGLAP
jgi:cysteinyl-tRNA synthetase, unknown class